MARRPPKYIPPNHRYVVVASWSTGPIRIQSYKTYRGAFTAAKSTKLWWVADDVRVLDLNQILAEHLAEVQEQPEPQSDFFDGVELNDAE